MAAGACCLSRLRSPPPPKGGKRIPQDPRRLCPWPLPATTPRPAPSDPLGALGGRGGAAAGPSSRPRIPRPASGPSRAQRGAALDTQPRPGAPAARARAPRGAPHLLAPVEQALALGPYIEERPDPLAQLLDGGFARNVLDGARLGAVDGADLDPHRGGTGTGDQAPLSGPALGPPRRAPPGPRRLPGRIRFSAAATRRTRVRARTDALRPRDRPPAPPRWKETGTRPRCERSPRLTNRKEPWLGGAHCLLIEMQLPHGGHGANPDLARSTRGSAPRTAWGALIWEGAGPPEPLLGGGRGWAGSPRPARPVPSLSLVTSQSPEA